MEFKSNIIKVLVKINMPKTEITGFDEERNAYRMNIHALPEKGKANLEIIKFFRKEYNKDARIISGFTSREKILRVV